MWHTNSAYFPIGLEMQSGKCIWHFFSNFWQVWIRLVTVVTLGCMMTKMTLCLVARPWWQTRRDLRYWKSLRFKLTIGVLQREFQNEGRCFEMRTQESETWLDYSKGKNNHNKYNCSGLLQKCARSDWSRFVSCLTKTTSCELITTGAQNFKMAALHLVNNSVGMITW